MVNIIDKIASKLTLDDIRDIAEDPTIFFTYDIRDDDGRIVEPKAWIGTGDMHIMHRTFEYLLTFMDEKEAYNRLVRNYQIEFALEYYGSKYAVHAIQFVDSKIMEILGGL